MARNPIVAVFALLGLLGSGVPAPAQEIAAVRTVTTQTGNSQQDSNSAQEVQLQLSARDHAIAGLWGLSGEEMQRAKLLLLGPRGAFSVANLSPVEALGIHARSDAERHKYARIFAQAQYADVQRVLAFQRAYDEEIRRLTSGQPMIDFKGLAKVKASIGAADMMALPRSQLINSNGNSTPREGQP
jgi:dihydrodipicolinate synthase/N-acetylneuraminate lyase